MVLGIVAVAGGMLCYLPALCGPVALVLGLKSLNAIKAQPHLGVVSPPTEVQSSSPRAYDQVRIGTAFPVGRAHRTRQTQLRSFDPIPSWDV